MSSRLETGTEAGTETAAVSENENGESAGDGEGLIRYSAQFLGVFDTVTSVIGYSADEETFSAYMQELQDELKIYHQLYDIYTDYEGINNIKTINDNAGIAPVVVDEKIIDMLEEARSLYELTGGKMNVAMGSVLSIWHEYRQEGIDDPLHSKLPPMDELEAAAAHTDISKVIIDREASTVYLEDPHMSLDVGSVAKGYAVEMVCRKLEEGQAFIESMDGVEAMWICSDGTEVYSSGMQALMLPDN